MQPACNTCQFWFDYKKAGVSHFAHYDGQCRKLPPYFWTDTKSDAWCGEYSQQFTPFEYRKVNNNAV
jgi:hypothetical protein